MVSLRQAMRLGFSALLIYVFLFIVGGHKALAVLPPVPNPQNGSIGVEGQINGSAPTKAATITLPSNGQSFSSIPITVSGLCTSGLLVEIFDNNVFVGSAQCVNGSFSLQIDLFNGRNDLIARVYDALNQSGPDSSTVTVTFNSGFASAGPLVALSSAYAKRGADPNSTLTWPITLSGGAGPYAISVDWGDGSTQELISRQTGGDFNIEHIYTQSGIFNVTIRATDASGATAFLQVVAISNGPAQQTTTSGGSKQSGNTTAQTQRVIVWWPFALTFGLTVASFWLGKRHQLETIRSHLRRGERPI